MAIVEAIGNAKVYGHASRVGRQKKGRSTVTEWLCSTRHVSSALKFLQSRSGCFLPCRFLVSGLPAPVSGIADQDLYGKGAFMAGALLRFDTVCGLRPSPRLCKFQKQALIIVALGRQRFEVCGFQHGAMNESAGGCDAPIQEQGANHGFQGISKNGRIMAAIASDSIVTHQDKLSKPHGAGLLGQRLPIDQFGAQRGQEPFRFLRELLVEMFGHHASKDRVSKEFQPFIGVVRTIRVRVQKTAVRKSALIQSDIAWRLAQKTNDICTENWCMTAVPSACNQPLQCLSQCQEHSKCRSSRLNEQRVRYPTSALTFRRGEAMQLARARLIFAGTLTHEELAWKLGFGS